MSEKRSKIDGPVETVRPTVGTGAPGVRGGLVGAKPDPGRMGRAPTIDVRKQIENEMVHRLAKSTAVQLIEDTARSLMRIMGLSTKDAAFCMYAAASAIDPETGDTPAPPG